MSLQAIDPQTEKREARQAAKLRLLLATMRPDSRVPRALLPHLGVHLSNRWLAPKIQAGLFPSPVALERTRRVWRYGDIVEWVHGRRSGWPVNRDLLEQCRAQAASAYTARKCGVGA